MRSFRPIELAEEERAELERLCADESAHFTLRKNARALLLMDQGVPNVQVARQVGYSERHISALRRRFWEIGVPGICWSRWKGGGAPRPGAASRYPANGTRARPVRLTEEEHAKASQVHSDPSLPPFIRRRAHALLLLHRGLSNGQVARNAGYTPDYVSRLRARFHTHRLTILAPRRQRLQSF